MYSFLLFTFTLFHPMPFGKLLYVFALLCLGSSLHGQYHIRYTFTDSLAVEKAPVKTSFPTQKIAEEYVATLPAQMAAIGFAAASVDAVLYGKDTADIQFYQGRRYQFYNVQPNAAAQKYFTAAGVVWPKKPSVSAVQQSVDKLLDYFENTGYPFAAVLLDSMHWVDNNLHAMVKVEPSIIYPVDSIHVEGKAKISRLYLQNFLRFQKGTLYNQQLLNGLNNRLAEMQFIEQSSPWQLNMLPAGGVLNLYLQPKRVNQINVLVGLAPSNEQLQNNRLLLTGEANINLKNALGAGETIGINWQQLQVKAPRINLLFQYPYIFH